MMPAYGVPHRALFIVLLTPCWIPVGTLMMFLVLDGHPVHKSKKVTDFGESTEGKLRLFILPPYSPHLNPDEWVWNWLKSHKLGRASVSDPDQFRSIVKKYLCQLCKLKNVIKGFFQDKNLAYVNA